MNHKEPTMTYQEKLATLPEAPYYECGEPDRLIDDSPEEAIRSAIERNSLAGDSDEAIAQRLAPLTVRAYRPVDVEDAWIRRTAEELLAIAAERFDEEYGDPDGDHPSFPKIEKHAAAFEALVREVFSQVTPCHCTEVGSVELDVDDLRAFLRDEAS